VRGERDGGVNERGKGVDWEEDSGGREGGVFGGGSWEEEMGRGAGEGGEGEGVG